MIKLIKLIIKMITRMSRRLSITANASEQVLFMTIADTFRTIETTQSRNEKMQVFLKMLHEISNKSKMDLVK